MMIIIGFSVSGASAVVGATGLAPAPAPSATRPMPPYPPASTPASAPAHAHHQVASPDADNNADAMDETVDNLQ
jgi:hypothetical protein